MRPIGGISSVREGEFRTQNSEFSRRSICDQFAAEALVEGGGGDDVGDFFGRSSGTVDVFLREAEGMAVVPDFFEGAANGGGIGGDVNHVFVALAAFLAVADVDDRSAEAGGFDDAGGGVANQDGGMFEKTEKQWPGHIPVNAD